ncbi:hypothetical protein DUI87_06036 [Hirundo rustica rustica]|uniref:Uncharacterized protein n=1 Tax=Hirundo rustica rustica TaxID=333673 RepID=A0A3M0L0Z5_HIRRU|nr:hypothetical protein DUI87_06036 [Hirundo rustica rustica]
MMTAALPLSPEELYVTVTSTAPQALLGLWTVVLTTGMSATTLWSPPGQRSLGLLQHGFSTQNTSSSQGCALRRTDKICKCINSLWKCSTDVCLVRQDLIQRINSGDYGWKADNYSQFWGMTVEEGFKKRLGTFPPSHSLLNMREAPSTTDLVIDSPNPINCRNTPEIYAENVTKDKETDIMKEIMDRGPVQGMPNMIEVVVKTVNFLEFYENIQVEKKISIMKVYDDFFLYKEGIYRHSQKAGSKWKTHSVKLLGEDIFMKGMGMSVVVEMAMD